MKAILLISIGIVGIHNFANADSYVSKSGFLKVNQLDFKPESLKTSCPGHELTVPHEEKRWEVAEFRQVAEIGQKKYFFQACRGVGASVKANQPRVGDRVAAFIYAADKNSQNMHLVWGETAEMFGSESFESPESIQVKNGIVLVAPHPSGGNGGFEGDFFLLNEKEVTLLESQSWVTEFNAKLPKGLWLMSRLYPNFHNMTFETDLWREKTDPHAAPSGGKARGTIAIDGNKIALRSVNFNLNELPKNSNY